MNHGIPLHDMLGFELDVPPPGSRVAEVHLPVRPEAMGQGPNLHGGAIATLVDLACALAVVSAIGFDPAEEHLVTSDMHVRYLGRARGERVTARAEVVKIGNRLVVVDCDVRDDGPDGELVAKADFSMMRVPVRPPTDDREAPT